MGHEGEYRLRAIVQTTQQRAKIMLDLLRRRIVERISLRPPSMIIYRAAIPARAESARRSP